MRWFVLLASLISALPTASAAPAPERPTLEALFESHSLDLEHPAATRWIPGTREILYREDDDDGATLWREDPVSGTRVAVASWSGTMDRLREQRPHAVPAGLGDVNSATGARFAPVVAPDGSIMVGSVAGDLFRLDLDDGEAIFLTGDPSPEVYPAFSPDSTRLAFVRSGDLHWIDLKTGVDHRLTDRGTNDAIGNGVPAWVYEEELDVRRSFWWSPDGSRIAFVQFDSSAVDVIPIVDAAVPRPGLELQRYPKAGRPNPSVRLGVIGLDGGDPLWIDVGEGDFYLPRAGWTPAGSLWFERLDRDQEHLELLTADPETGEAHVLLSEHDDAWINIRDDLRFLSDGRFLWTSEHDGWNHLYLYSDDGHLIRRLTEGRWMIDGVAGVDADERTVVFRANVEDPRRWSLWALDLETGARRRLGDSSGSHRALLSPDGGYLVDTWSTLDRPPRADLVRISDGAVVRNLWNTENQLQEWDLLPIEPGEITADDGTVLHSLLMRPRDFDPDTKYPVVLYVYGGPHSQLTADRWGGSIHHTYRLFAEMGIATFLIDNRGTWGRGHAFEAAVHRRLGGPEITDQLTAVRWLRAQPWVDADRIAVYGGSYGGYMTLMLMLTAPETFRAGIAYAPVTDWKLYDSIYTERYMDTPADNPEGYERSAPLNLADRLEGTLLIAHGLRDNNVHLHNTLQMVARFAGADKEFELMIYPGSRHGIRHGPYALHFHRLKLDFLRRTLLEDR